jgi:uncharacterized membrane protein
VPPDDDSRRAFRWQEGDDDLQLLLTDWSMVSSAVGIHDGKIAGWEGSPFDGFVYVDGNTTDLPALDTGLCTHAGDSEPVAIAARGVAGRASCYWVNEEGEWQGGLAAAVVWLADTYELVELPGLPEASTPRLRDINDKGQVVGAVWKDQIETAVLWEVSGDGGVTEPEVLLGDIALPYAINNDGDVVGQIASGDGAQLVTRDGGVLDLQPLNRNDDPVSANALTDRADGQILVVGHSGERPVLWTVDATRLEVESVVELELPEGRYKAAYPVAVNSTGVIVGFSNTRPGGGRQPSRSHATVWWPVDGTD